jgi:hypothetical protein
MRLVVTLQRYVLLVYYQPLHWAFFIFLLLSPATYSSFTYTRFTLCDMLVMIS